MQARIPQLRSTISTILTQNCFYYLPLIKLTQILKLLQMPQSSQPNSILQSTYTGITRLYEKYKQKINNHIWQEKFFYISKDMKQLLYNMFMQIHQIRERDILSKQYQQQRQQGFIGMFGANTPQGNINHYYAMMMQQQAMSQQGISQQTIRAQQYHPTSTQSTNQNLDIQNAVTQEMRKKYQMYMVNQQLAAQMNPHMGIPMSNQFMGMQTNPTTSFSNMRPVQKGIPTNAPFGMMSYPPNMIMNPMLPTQYVPPYPPNIGMPYSSHQIGQFEKTTQALTKNPISQSTRQSQLVATSQTNDQKGPIARQYHKIIQKPLSKPVQKTPVKQVLPIQTLQKPQGNNFLPKKLLYKQTKVLEVPNQIFKNCACKGFYQYSTHFKCINCQKYYHFQCLGMNKAQSKCQIIQDLNIKTLDKQPTTQIIQQKENNQPSKQKVQEPVQGLSCAFCKLRQSDPLNKVDKVISQVYLMNITEKNYVTLLNFKPFQSIFRQKPQRYQIQIRCIRAGDHMNNMQITWPDECMMKINGDKIVEIPALQSNSSLKKRKDYSVYITQNLFNKSIYLNEFSNLLQKVRFSIQMKVLTQQQIAQKKMKNSYTFALGIYLVQKLSPQQLFLKISLKDHITRPSFLSSMMSPTSCQLQIDKLTIKLLDPYSWDIISHPVRGQKCSHAQCFDLKTFISLMNSARNRTWKCPLCSKQARKFVVDQEQVAILKQAKSVNPIPKQAIIYRDGRIAFRVEKDSDDQQDKERDRIAKTKKIFKDKKEEVK